MRVPTGEPDFNQRRRGKIQCREGNVESHNNHGMGLEKGTLEYGREGGTDGRTRCWARGGKAQSRMGTKVQATMADRRDLCLSLSQVCLALLC